MQKILLQIVIGNISILLILLITNVISEKKANYDYDEMMCVNVHKTISYILRI